MSCNVHYQQGDIVVKTFVTMWMFLGLTIVLAGLIHWLLNGNYGYWKKRGVPNPPTTPWVGNVGPSITMKKSLGQIYTEMYNNYKDCLYVGFFKIQNPGVLVRDVELLKTVMVKEFSSFHDNDIESDETIDPIFGKNPFVLKGHKWKVMRSYVTNGITTGKIKNMFTLMSNVSKNLVTYLNNEPEAKGKDGLEAKELAAKFTTDVVATCAFGLEGNSFIDPDSEFRRMGRKLFSADTWTAFKFVMMFIMPKLTLFLRIKLIPDDVRDWFMGVLKETIKYREENKIVRNDYLDLMLALKTKTTEYEFTDIDVMAQAMTFYGDGFETSSVALSFALFEIAKNPEVQIKLQNEVDTVLKKHGGEITYEAVQEMPYLDKILSEALRKYPPGMFLAKVCTKAFKFPPPRGTGTGKEVLIEEGTTVIIPIYALHYDPAYYPDPERFDPERFSEEAKNARPKCTYLPFGEGPRMCLGYRFALTQIKAAVVGIAHNFDIKENPKTLPTFEPDPNYFMLGKKGGIWLNFYKRNK